MTVRIFVAGSKGQVALSLQEHAKAEGLELYAVGRPDFDLTDPDSMQKAITEYAPTAIINAAAYTAVDAAEGDEITATRINADGAGKLAKIAARAGIPFIHVSTDYVFDGTKETPYTEDDAVRPASAYGRSKLAGEIAVQAENTNAIILRTAWVYSPHGKNFLKTMLTLAKSRDTLGVVSDQIGNPTYAADIASSILEILTKIHVNSWQDQYAGVYHLAGTGTASWHDFATEIFEEGGKYGHPVPTINAITTAEFPTPAQRPANSQLDCSKLLDTFGITMPEWQTSTAKCVKRLFAEDLLV